MSIKNIYYKSCAVITVLALTPAVASAKDLKDTLGTVNANVSAVADTVAIVSYIAGIAFGLAGILKLKEYMEKPGSGDGLKGPMSRLLVAGFLLALPTILNIMVSSTTGTDGGVQEVKF